MNERRIKELVKKLVLSVEEIKELMEMDEVIKIRQISNLTYVIEVKTNNPKIVFEYKIACEEV